MSAVLPLKESSRELIVEVARALEPYFGDITAGWREKITEEFHFEGRALVALERIQVAGACSYLAHNDFQGFIENLSYAGTRLAKLRVDTRLIAFALQVYQAKCEPYLGRIFGERRAQAAAALDTLSSATFVTVSGAYFDAKTAEAAALLSVLDAELSAGSLQLMLKRILEISRGMYGAAVGLILLQQEPEALRVEAAVGMGEDGAATPGLGETFAARIAQSGEGAISLDPGHDERVGSDALSSKVKTLWGMPLKKEGKVLGVLLLGFDRPYEWLPTERELLRAIAERSALAIDRARITAALEERESRIAELSTHLMRAQEDERKRISRELHDETGQALMVVRLYLGMLESAVNSKAANTKIHETLQVVDRTIEGIRRIIGRLSPLVLQELGLVAAIRRESKEVSRTSGLKVRVTVADEIGRLDPETETALYRIVQEALHNVAKHAHAHAASVHLECDGSRVRLLVADDGLGFNPKSSNSRGHSFGLAGIKERVNSMGGRMRLESAKGKGTRLEVTVPAAPASEARKPGAIAAAAPVQ